MRTYKPRRMSKRWLDGDCPKQVLGLYDNGGKSADRYTVLYVGLSVDAKGTVWMGGRAMNAHPMHPQGIGLYFECPVHELTAWRLREKKVRWTALPDDVKKCIRLDCEAMR